MVSAYQLVEGVPAACCGGQDQLPVGIHLLVRLRRLSIYFTEETSGMAGPSRYQEVFDDS
jgi:hypothetical protein